MTQGVIDQFQELFEQARSAVSNGHNSHAKEFIRKAFPLIESMEDGPRRTSEGALCLLLGEISFLESDLQDAESHFRSALNALHGQEEVSGLLNPAVLGLARTMAGRGEHRETLMLVRDLLVSADLSPQLRTLAEDLERSSLLVLGRVNELKGAQESLTEESEVGVMLAAAKAAQLEGELSEALRLLSQAEHCSQYFSDSFREYAGSFRIILAETLSDARRFAEAEVAYKEAVTELEERYDAKHPELALPLCGLGEICLLQGEVDDAEKFFLVAHDLLEDRYDTDKDLVKVCLMLASFYRDVRSDYEAVERYLAKAIYMAEALPLSREFPISNIRWQRGRNLIQLGQLEDAQIEFELLLGQEGETLLTPTQLEGIGISSHLNGKFDLETKCFELAARHPELSSVKKRKRKADILTHYGACLYRAHRFVEAFDALNESFQLRQETMDDSDKAFQKYRKAILGETQVLEIASLELPGMRKTRRSTDGFVNLPRVHMRATYEFYRESRETERALQVLQSLLQAHEEENDDGRLRGDVSELVEQLGLGRA